MAAATVSVTTTLTCTLTQITWLPSGDYAVTFSMVDPTGTAKRIRTFKAMADGSGVYDEAGNQIAATTPAALLTNLGNVKTNIDTALTNAAAAGKFTL